MSGIKCIFAGNLGNDAVLRMLENGRHVLSFWVATTKKWTTAAGVRQQRTIWVRCSMFGQRAPALAPHLTKGVRVFVQDSELVVHRRETADGDREYWGVVVHDLDFGGGSRTTTSKGDPARANDAHPRAPVPRSEDVGAARSRTSFVRGADRDIPF